jgi:arylsulfatase A-like enzyme
MNQNMKKQSLTFGIGALLLPAICLSQKQVEKKPNIILVMADDQGWGDTGYNGHPVLKTPNLDEMASVGLRFDRFYASSPVCSPTRGSVLTGRHPNRFGDFCWGNTLRPQEITIAEALKTVGYATGHFGKWHLGSVYNGSPVNPGASGFDEWVSSPNMYEIDPILSKNGIAVQMKGEGSMVAVDAALDFIKRKKDSDHPFLAVVWFGSPHAPHIASPDDKELYPECTDSMKNYCGEITAMDRAFGKLRNSLHELGIAQNTILWYCSDNGGCKGVSVSGGRGNKGDVYEGGLRVPAILEWPERLKNHRITDIPCYTSDMYPTLLDIVNVKVPDQLPLDGISLVNLIDNKMDKRSKAMGFWNAESNGKKVSSEVWMAEMLRDQREGKPGDESRLFLNAGDTSKKYPLNAFPGEEAWLDWPWKLHRIEKKNNVKFELYNLVTDPLEVTNVIDQNTDLAKKMKAELNNWLLSVVHSLNGGDYK